MPQPTSTTNTSQLQNQFAQQQGQQNVATDTSGTQTRDPYSGSLPFLNDIMGQSQALYNQPGQQNPMDNPYFATGLSQQVQAASDIQPGTMQAWYNALDTMAGKNAALQAAGG